MTTPSALHSDNAHSPATPKTVTFERSYIGTADQVRQVRADLTAVAKGCPVADDLVLLGSELATNAVVHSRSGLPGGLFTVRAEVCLGDSAWLEVEDQGGPWIERERADEDENGRGLALVAALAGHENWTIESGSTPGTRVVWVWLDWHRDQAS
jgi:anti-sigma regulatory factor (Ser/Thr protein kinase)